MKLSFKIIVLVLLLSVYQTPVFAYQQDYLPTDPNVIYQTYFDVINAKPSWSNDIKVNKEVVVAILDSGVDLDHPDLVDNIWTNTGEIPDDGLDNDNNSYVDDIHGWNFIDSNNNPQPVLSQDYDFTAVNHGTVVAGIIAAAANDAGILGIAPKVKIMPLKILDSKGSGNTLVLSQAIDYAVENGADIINLSLVGKAIDDKLKKAIINAYNHGVMLVAASGNESNLGVDLDSSPHYPVCDFDNINRVIGVAAVDQNKKLSSFSNYGEKCIDISAPGTNIYSTVFQDVKNEDFGAYYRGGWAGTSVAAPMVSATLALLKQQYPDWQPEDYYNILLAGASSLQAANPNDYKDLGKGLLDVGAALTLADKYYSQEIKLVLAPQAGLAPEVLIMDDQGKLQKSFLAYDKKYLNGVNIAVGDVDGDGQQEIVTVPQGKGGPHLRIFDADGNLKYQWFAYANTMQSGLNLAVADLDRDGKAEIIVAPQAGGGSQVKVFKYNGDLLTQFFGAAENFKGGLSVAAGDLNNDGQAEIVTAPMSGTDPQVRVFSEQGLLLSIFLAYDKKAIHGLQVTVGDVDGDAWPEIVTIPAKGTAPLVKIFDMNGAPKSNFIAYSQYLTSGVRLLARDISGDHNPEILALPNKGNAALLRVYDAQGLEKESFYLRNPYDKNGYNLEVLIR